MALTCWRAGVMQRRVGGFNRPLSESALPPPTVAPPTAPEPKVATEPKGGAPEFPRGAARPDENSKQATCRTSGAWTVEHPKTKDSPELGRTLS